MVRSRGVHAGPPRRTQIGRHAQAGQAGAEGVEWAAGAAATVLHNCLLTLTA